MHINKVNLNNNFNKMQFKQNQDSKNKYIYVNQASIDNYKLPLAMGLIYSQFEFNRPDKEVKEVFKQKLNDFKSKNFAKKCKSILIPIVATIGLALACESFGFKKQFKIEKKKNEIFETIMISSVVGMISEYILKDMKNREKAMEKTLATIAITMGIWGTLSLISGIKTFKNYKKENN